MRNIIKFFIILFFSMESNGQWLETDLHTSHIFPMASNKCYIFSASVSGDFFRCPINSISWEKISSNIYVRDIVAYDTIIYIATNSGIYFSKDNGITYICSSNGLPSNIAIDCISISNENMFAGTWGAGVFRSTDKGMNWFATNITNCRVDAIVNFNNTVFAGTMDKGILISNDLGSTYFTLSYEYRFHTLSFLLYKNKIFSGSMSGLYYSTDTGIRWFLSQTAYHGAIWSLITDGFNIFAAAENSGIIMSTDGGENWNNILNGNPYSINIFNGYIYAGMRDGKILYRRLDEIITSLEFKQNTPNIILLKQNYPNPFNPITTIAYELPKESYVILEIIDLLGQRIALLYDGIEQPGYHTCQFNATNFGAGIYLSRLIVENNVQIAKMVLIK